MVFRGVFGRLEPALDTRYFGMHVVMWFSNFLIKQPKGGRPREGDTTHGVLGWFDGGVDFYSGGFIGRARWGFGGIGRLF